MSRAILDTGLLISVEPIGLLSSHLRETANRLSHDARQIAFDKAGVDCIGIVFAIRSSA
jgi:hypothetical protein